MQLHITSVYTKQLDTSGKRLASVEKEKAYLRRWAGKLGQLRLNKIRPHHLSRHLTDLAADGRGMASWIPIRLDDPMNPVGYFKANLIRNPSDKIMLAEEASEDENEKIGASAGAFENSAWDWGFATRDGQKRSRDPVTLRHRSKGGVLHADGHVAVVGTNYWHSPRHYDPTWAE